MEVVGNIVVCDTFTILKKSINAINVGIEEVVFKKIANYYTMDFSNYNGIRLFNSYGDKMTEMPESLKDEVVEFNIRFKLNFHTNGNPNAFQQIIIVEHPKLSTLTVEYINNNNNIFRGILKDATHKFLLEMNKKIFTSEDLSLN